MGITFDTPASSVDGTRRITGVVTSVGPLKVSFNPGRPGLDMRDFGKVAHCGQGACSSAMVAIQGLLTVHTVHTTPASQPSPDMQREQTIEYTATLTCRGEVYEHMDQKDQDRPVAPYWGTHCDEDETCCCARIGNKNLAFDFDFEVDGSGSTVLTSAERWLLEAYALPMVGSLTPHQGHGDAPSGYTPATDDEDEDEEEKKSPEPRVTAVSPVLQNMFAALPTVGWKAVDGSTPARFLGHGENRREVKPATPPNRLAAGLDMTYFKLLGDWISRDEFIMINDVPLVVSTWGGDK